MRVGDFIEIDISGRWRYNIIGCGGIVCGLIIHRVGQKYYLLLSSEVSFNYSGRILYTLDIDLNQKIRILRVWRGNKRLM